MAHTIATIFIEIGSAFVLLALLARLADRWGFSTIPLFLVAGLAFGNGGLLPLKVSSEFTHLGGEIGIILLLFTLGLEYTGHELSASLRRQATAGIVDLLLNSLPGVAVALLMGWGPVAAMVLGGVTYVTSSGVAVKVLNDLRRSNNPESSVALSIMVIEDLAMTVYLPIASVLLAGKSVSAGISSVAMALSLVAVILYMAIRHSATISRLVTHGSDEVVLLTTFGLVLLVAGIAQHLQVSSAVGAFLVGVALSGPLAERTSRLVMPMRDLFVAMFFFFFGLQIDPSTLPPVIYPAIGLGILGMATKLLTGWWAARRVGLDWPAQFRAGSALVARGEFSIVIAGLAMTAGLPARLGALSAAYVLFLAIAGPVVARYADRISELFSHSA